jgi:amino acid transporter
LIAFVLSVFGSFIWLAAMSALVRVLIYVGCIAAMPRLRRKANELDAPGFELTGGWTIPIIALLSSGVLLIQLSLQSLLATLATVAVGSAIYWIMPRQAPETSDR